ncbi:MAG: DNA-processing protein DprA [Bacilli bacterium]|nr:DNA-processing protein DprA [Bacilli bacterium]
MLGKDLLVYLSLKYKGDFKKMIDAIHKKEEVNDEVAMKALKTIKSKYITILDQAYPEELRHVYMPPLVLYYYGDISLLKSEEVKVAVIGSRESTSYGEKMTRDLVEPLAKKRRIIVSGLARGIDAIAHDTCIKSKGKTIAVLGSGIDYCYPTSNRKLYDEIKMNHLLISEYPNALSPTPDNFPSRNRIVAGIANKVLVTEAYINSGTNITVLYALRQGKDVMAVPHEANHQSACNRLIQDGAFLVENAEDVLYLTEKKY